MVVEFLPFVGFHRLELRSVDCGCGGWVVVGYGHGLVLGGC